MAASSGSPVQGSGSLTQALRAVEPRTWTRAVIVAAAAAAFAVPGGGPADAAWDGTQKIRAGDKVEASFVGAAHTERHAFAFYVPEGTKFSAEVKADKGTTLVPELDLLDVGLNEVATGGSTTKFKNFILPGRGAFSLEVHAAGGTGGYLLTTKVKYPKKAGGSTVTESFDFAAPAGTLVTASVKPAKNSGAVPTILAVEGPTGEIAGIVPGSTGFKKVAVPVDGSYAVLLDNAGPEGSEVLWELKLVPPKGGRKWSFDFVDAPRGIESRIREQWLGSGHAEYTAEAFRHWDHDVPAVVPTSCARCHTGSGYEDFLGSDGSTANVVDTSHVPDRTVDCEACHNTATAKLTTVTFPSGKVVSGLGDESRCMVCHQGRESKVSVDSMIANANPATPDTVSSGIRFRNIHYFAAAASLYGREAQGAYEYDGLAYERKFTHVESHNVCFECHNQHTLEIRVSECAVCHEISNPADYEQSIEDLRDVRMAGSVPDYDGDGDREEGVYREMQGMGALLYAAMREYAFDVTGTGIVYDSHTYPYFFADTDNDGTLDPGEGGFAKWTSRLVKAAYNYQFWQKDPGAFAHNGKYHIEFMYDSIAELDAHALVDVTRANGYSVAFAELVRNDGGHFDTSADAYRNWDTDSDGAVNETCARCHSTGGFQFRHKYGIDTTLPEPPVSGVACEMCHEQGADFKGEPAVRYFKSVTWPSLVQSPITTANGAQGTDQDDESFACIQCHQGRSSTQILNDRIGKNQLTFQNVHYLPAGATLWGDAAKVAYQYDLTGTGRTYVTKFTHGGDPSGFRGRCMFCHGPEHSFEVQTADEEGESKGCDLCHGVGVAVEDYKLWTAIGVQMPDLDGDGAVERINDELTTFGNRLFDAMRSYTTAKGKAQIVYDSHAYPYFFIDTDGDNVKDANETTGYNQFDATLLKAAYNYQYWQKEPGAWAHNPKYGFQILWESINNVVANGGGGFTNFLTVPTTLTRP